MADTFTSLIEAFKNVGVSKAYGSPVQLGGEEVIPVALVSFGFGGGGEAGEDGASGGGGGGMVIPLGVYRRRVAGWHSGPTPWSCSCASFRSSQQPGQPSARPSALQESSGGRNLTR